MSYSDIHLWPILQEIPQQSVTKPSLKIVCLKFHSRAQWVNSLRPRQDGRHFADDSFTCIFFNENCCILIKFSLKYVRKGPIDNNPALVQIMAWRRSGDRPLSEPMMVSLPTHICVTRPQWVNADVSDHDTTWCNMIHVLHKALTHWGRDKMDAISQTTFSSAFSWMKMFELQLKFHWSLFLRDQLTIFHHCFR